MILRLIVITLALAPGVASAACSDRHEQAMSCADGSNWDDESQTCVPVVSS